MSGFGLAGVLLALAAAAPAAGKPEHRCGWLMNETPGNWELLDRDGRWTIGAQGGYQAPGIDDMPDMSTAGWVDSNGAHGYGCACMDVVTDARSMRVLKLSSAVSKPIALCRADRKLPKP